MSTLLAPKVMQKFQSKLSPRMALSEVEKVPSFWSFRRMLRMMFSYVPHLRAAVPVPGGGVLSGEDVYSMRFNLIRAWGMGAMCVGVTMPSIFLGVLALDASFKESPLIWLAVPTILFPFVMTLRMITAYKDVAENKVFTGVAVRLIVARRGTYRSPAAWIVDPQMWNVVYGRIVGRLSLAEQDVVVALAEEWQGSVKELIFAAPMLAGLPVNRKRFSFKK